MYADTCYPQEFARWCQHQEIYCDIIAYGDEFGDAMKQLWGTTAELEACLDRKDLDHCGPSRQMPSSPANSKR